MIEIGPLRPGDRAAWEVLARGYKTFYQESERTGSTGTPRRATPGPACSTTRWRDLPDSSATRIPCSPAGDAQHGGLDAVGEQPDAEPVVELGLVAGGHRHRA